MKRLALVVHFHQPVGNLDRVVRNATDRCYRPFLDVLASHPDVPMTLHYSGCLLEWLEANATDVADAIRTLVERGQVELMTGGFYEPILAAIPPRDRTGQIRMMSEHLATRYGADATGLWLTERVWEQDVTTSLVDAGVRYTVIDDTIFHAVGVTDEQLKGPFVTEHDGRPLLVYAGDRRLRYLIPYKRADRILDHVRSSAEDRLFVYADDGEKFGEWPDTYERVYEKGWLESFFRMLEEGPEELALTTLGAHATDARGEGRVYLPSSSYDEMMTWALPAAARLIVGRARRRLSADDPEGLLPFVRGAPWRAFMAKYPEVNQLQKRMLFVSDEVHAADAPVDALRDLYRAQCNCAYWHGAFGGLYLSFMRSALWHHLMRAEASVRSEPTTRLLDLDADARDEVLITGSWGAAVVSAADARLVELDDWTFGANLLAVAARHREAYHLEEENPPEDQDDDEMPVAQARADIDRDSLTFDEAPLGGLIDIVDRRRLEGYSLQIEDARAIFSTRLGEDLEIVKEFAAEPHGLRCTHTLANTSNLAKKVLSFASETSALPLNLGRDAPQDEFEARATGWLLKQPEAEVALEMTCDPMGEVTHDPIETASATLEGLIAMHQGTKVTTTWRLTIPPGDSATITQYLRPAVRSEAASKTERGVSA